MDNFLKASYAIRRKENPLFLLHISECSSLNLSEGLEKGIKKGPACKDRVMVASAVAEIMEVVGGLESKTLHFYVCCWYVQG